MNTIESANGKPVYLFISHQANIGYLSCLEDLTRLTKHNIALIVLLHSGLRWQYDYGKESARKMFNDCYCKIILDRPALDQSKDFIKQSNDLITYNPDDKSYFLKIDFEYYNSSKSHLLFLGDNPAIIANSPDGSSVISRNYVKARGQP